MGDYITYIQSLNVSYSNPPDSGSVLQCYDSNGRDIGVGMGDCNKGFGGDFVFLTPNFTKDRNQAARGFRVFQSGDSRDGLSDMGKGAGGDYRYQKTETGPGPVIYVALIRSSDSLERVPSALSGKYAYMSSDINSGRGGDYLHLIWGPRA